MKIVAIASAGGHWIQLLRLVTAFEGHEVVFMGTNSSFAETVPEHTFVAIPDGNRWNKWKLVLLGIKIGRKILQINPDVIVTTGAAPGLMAIIVGKLMGCRTLWIDSIANVESISLSGRVAVYFADRVHTQWEALAGSRITYAGSVLT